ncbi:hypothetical protein SKAU_G00305610 [Synaphobranchus kaupii]|uniref:Cytochrome P450 1A n=1 Tax=Synaphobranchus kaupii TaxID=118154 RepID=A0A9Q1EQT2_SYNKA|nr:hypothetical protein SKAU_G00305610 [Synaphobranchus kaupii]
MALMNLPVVGPVSVCEGLVAMVTVCLAYLLLRLLHKEIPEGLKRLPGPKPIPIIGNVLEVSGNPHLSLTDMSKRYGPVFQIQIGMRPVVVLSGSQTVRQALIKQGEDFSGRPDLYSFQFINNGKSLAFSTDQTGVWRARRKLALSALRSFSTIEGSSSEYSCVLEEHISKEGEHLVKRLSAVTEASGSFDPFRHIVVSVANVICGMCFGRRYSHDDQELLSIVNMSHEFTQVASTANPADFIPFLRFLPSRTMKAFVDMNGRFTAFLQKIVSEHYNSFDKNNIRDITDSLIDHCEDRKLDENSNTQVSDEKVVGIVNDLFGAGFDTISTFLSWAVMYLVAYPEIQEKLHQELRENVGMDRSPRLSDKSNLPLLEAFIMEILRHSSFVPFTIPHCTTKDTSLNGFYIPKDTCVFVNQWQVNHDPTAWKEPSTFSLERFLNADGTSVNKLEAEKVMVFGLGKRRCIGEAIGRTEIFLFLAILLQRLHFHELSGHPLDMTPEYGLTMKHKRCQLCASLRPQDQQ